MWIRDGWLVSLRHNFCNDDIAFTLREKANYSFYIRFNCSKEVSLIYSYKMVVSAFWWAFANSLVGRKFSAFSSWVTQLGTDIQCSDNWMCIICMYAKIYFRKTLEVWRADLELTRACYLWLWLFLITARITVSCERGKKENKKCGDSLITSIPWFPQDPVLVKKSGAPVRRRWGAKSWGNKGYQKALHIWAGRIGHYFD